jgi:uncharacterized membrane protein YkoI
MARFILSLVLAASLWPALTASAAPGAVPAVACYSDAQTRAAIQAGQAQPLSNFIAVIQTQIGGQVAGSARLCPVGGRLTYFVTILVGPTAREVRVDALSGAIL